MVIPSHKSRYRRVVCTDDRYRVLCLVVMSAAISEPIIQKIIYLFKRLERRRFHHHQSEEVCSDFFV